jgi:hypothetical protein
MDSPLLGGANHSDDLAVVTYSEDGVVTSLNAHGVLLLGMRESEVVGVDVCTLVCPDTLDDEGHDSVRLLFGLALAADSPRASSPSPRISPRLGCASPIAAASSPTAGSSPGTPLS